jgi:hypothetical protein
VDASSLEKAVALTERLVAAAQAAHDSIVTFNSLANAADDIVICKLQADETPRMILGELQALRRDMRARMRLVWLRTAAYPVMRTPVEVHRDQIIRAVTGN